MSKGSQRRPGEIPPDRWEAIFGKKPQPVKDSKDKEQGK